LPISNCNITPVSSHLETGGISGESNAQFLKEKIMGKLMNGGSNGYRGERKLG